MNQMTIKVDSLNGELNQTVIAYDSLKKDLSHANDIIKLKDEDIGYLKASYHELVLSAYAAFVLKRDQRTGKPPEQLLKEDPEYQARLSQSKTEIEQAHKRLQELKPKFLRYKEILDSVL